ncbi:MAG TPA: rhomboid family intramembrane serine protease, partial [Polyangiaceae bacterium]|nr:rhomboid family intramembrane serine protease [Polyangiaceae bacterium]
APDTVTLDVAIGDREQGEATVELEAVAPEGLSTVAFRPAVGQAMRDLRALVDQALRKERLAAARQDTEDTLQPEAPPPAKERWYGWQTLVADTGSVLVFLFGAGIQSSSNSSAVLDFGIAGYLLAPPVIHFAHGNVGYGFASLGIRAGAPIVLGLVGAFFGAAASSNSNGNINGQLGGFFYGLIGGMVLGYGAAVTLDAAVFSYEKLPRRGEDAWFTLRPDLSVAPGRGTAGVAGTF